MYLIIGVGNTKTTRSIEYKIGDSLSILFNRAVINRMVTALLENIVLVMSLSNVQLVKRLLLQGKCFITKAMHAHRLYQ